MEQVFVKDEQERIRDRKRLNILREQILQEVPEAGIASDQDYRVADLAIDFCEDVPPLPQEKIDTIVKLFKEAGAIAKISSIHVNGWFGNYDKLSMAGICLKNVANLDITTDNDRIVFLGDSPNDSPMFAHFRNSVGVANVADFTMETPPNWITASPSGEGFCEFVDLLLKARSRI